MLDRRQIHTVIDTLIREARIRSVSDIHITEGMHVWYRIHGCLTQARDVLKEYDIREVLLGMMNEKQRKQFEDGQDVDFAWQTTDGCRQRVNIFCEQKKIAATIRLLNQHIPTLEELKIPTTLYQLSEEPRGIILVTGPTGSGKSTLLKLIMNQLQPTKGEIVINGINLQELDLNSYYSHIKYLNKTPVFYKESLRTNMIFDRLFLEDKMIELLHYFMLDDLVNGLDLKLDEQGGFLSSGQGQLVMIIRALLSEPDVLILDEAFSNIDQERLQLLINYLNFQKIIVIIVSHQINMMNCQFDCVIIDSGKIVGEEDYGNRFST